MKIKTIFRSIDGEVNFYGQGVLTTFVRFAGCSFGCPWCDTPSAQSSDHCEELTTEQVVRRIRDGGCPKVTITGGEPLEQKDELVDLLKMLRWYDIDATLETNGAHRIDDVVGLVDGVVMDYKLHAPHRMVKSNIRLLRDFDFLKFPIGDAEDYREAIKALELWTPECSVAFSPIHGVLDPAVLLNWLVVDRQFRIYLNIQIHKLIGVE